MGFDLNTAAPVATGGFDLSTAKPAPSGIPAQRRSFSDVPGEALATLAGEPPVIFPAIGAATRA